MKRKITGQAVLGLLFSLILFCTTAAAAPILIGTTQDLLDDVQWTSQAPHPQPHAYAKNDREFNVNWLVDSYNQDPSNTQAIPDSLTLLGKYEDGNWLNPVWGNDTPYFNVYDWWDSGIWTETSQAFDGPIYFSIKTSPQFSLYYAGNSTFSYWENGQLYTVPGSYWNTAEAGWKQMSHISFWTATPDTPPNPVPEPGTVLMFGLGVLGLAGMGRKYMS